MAENEALKTSGKAAAAGALQSAMTTLLGVLTLTTDIGARLSLPLPVARLVGLILIAFTIYAEIRRATPRARLTVQPDDVADAFEALGKTVTAEKNPALPELRERLLRASVVLVYGRAGSGRSTVVKAHASAWEHERGRGKTFVLNSLRDLKDASGDLEVDVMTAVRAEGDWTRNREIWPETIGSPGAADRATLLDLLADGSKSWGGVLLVLDSLEEYLERFPPGFSLLDATKADRWKKVLESPNIKIVLVGSEETHADFYRKLEVLLGREKLGSVHVQGITRAMCTSELLDIGKTKVVSEGDQSAVCATEIWGDFVARLLVPLVHGSYVLPKFLGLSLRSLSTEIDAHEFLRAGGVRGAIARLLVVRFNEAAQQSMSGVDLSSSERLRVVAEVLGLFTDSGASTPRLSVKDVLARAPDIKKDLERTGFPMEGLAAAFTEINIKQLLDCCTISEPPMLRRIEPAAGAAEARYRLSHDFLLTPLQVVYRYARPIYGGLVADWLRDREGRAAWSALRWLLPPRTMLSLFYQRWVQYNREGHESSHTWMWRVLVPRFLFPRSIDVVAEKGFGVTLLTSCLTLVLAGVFLGDLSSRFRFHDHVQYALDCEWPRRPWNRAPTLRDVVARVERQHLRQALVREIWVRNGHPVADWLGSSPNDRLALIGAEQNRGYFIEPWGHSQALAAITYQPWLRDGARREDRAASISRSYAVLFAPDASASGQYVIEHKAAGWTGGWVAPYPIADPLLWTALAMALNGGDRRPEEVAQFSNYWRYVYNSMAVYSTGLDDARGGTCAAIDEMDIGLFGQWCLFPEQINRDDWNPYTTSLALIALTEIADSSDDSIPADVRVWSRCAISRTAHALLRARGTGASLWQWSGRPNGPAAPTMKEGVSWIATYALLHAVRTGHICVSEEIRAIQRLVPEMLESVTGRRSLVDDGGSENYNVPFRFRFGGSERIVSFSHPIRFTWHSWAIAAAGEILASPPEELSQGEVASVARSLERLTELTREQLDCKAGRGVATYLLAESLFTLNMLHRASTTAR